MNDRSSQYLEVAGEDQQWHDEHFVMRRLLENAPAVWVVEEAAASGRLKPRSGQSRSLFRLYRVGVNGVSLAGEREHGARGRAGTNKSTKANLILELLDGAKVGRGIVVCGFQSASVFELAKGLHQRKIDFVLNVGHDTCVRFARARGGKAVGRVGDRLPKAEWKSVRVGAAQLAAVCKAAHLGRVEFAGVRGLQSFALSIGGIKNNQRGILLGLASIADAGIGRLAHLLMWNRWIRIGVRKATRGDAASVVEASSGRKTARVDIIARPNRRLAESLDAKNAENRVAPETAAPALRGTLAGLNRGLNVTELFAGAGGMGLGFLMAAHGAPNRYNIAASAEINPIYLETLKRNQRFVNQSGLREQGAVPGEWIAMDLKKERVRSQLNETAGAAGEIDVVIGGPPCQGFSAANRNSWSHSNPNNRLVDAFLDCIDLLSPKVLLMENVQGILWTGREATAGATLSVAAHVARRLARMGYVVFPKLLDAAWYGVPQNRSRFFLLGLHSDLGYTAKDFDEWGPFPKPTHGPGAVAPYATVRQAIGDLPHIPNGATETLLPYNGGRQRGPNAFLEQMRAGASADTISDHTTSLHADYVIDRYRRIPQGGNWESVRDMMTNYAEVERTHSNIYRRLSWSEPSITIGHYRKSMIVHPSQHRGLSLREASRLQSFPDWFRFSGGVNSRDGAGLVHKQQQLANAVCPLVTKAVAEYLLKL